MKNILTRYSLTTIATFALALGPCALAQDAATQLGNARRLAQQELESSLKELATLREQIAAEKLPLAQQLDQLEEELTKLRREHERVSRIVDGSNLELANLKAEMKARHDELTYIGNLLDEYARTFESKVSAPELQHYGHAITAAKQASENTTLTLTEKFAAQLTFVETSLQRLFKVIGGMRFPGQGVDPQGNVVRGQFAIIGPVALFGAANDGLAGVAIPQTESPNPLIRPLTGALQQGLAALIATGEGLLPLDPSRGGALQALVQKVSLIHIFKKGGPIMWPLLFCSILALGTVIERLIFLVLEQRRRDWKTLQTLLDAVAQGDVEGAIRIGNQSQFFVVKALTYALVHREKSLANALLYSQQQELKRYRRGIPILDTIITLAPLLGLLGTVTGMMGSFSLIGGELSAPGAITGGIAEALIATACGLGIAILCLIPFNFLNARMEDARHEMEAAATQLELLLKPQTSVVAAIAHAQHPAEPVPAGV